MSYKELWRRVPAALGFILPGFPIALVSFTTTLTLIAVGAATSIVYVGIPILCLGLMVARWFGSLELARLRAAGEPPIEAPVHYRHLGSLAARSWAIIKSGTSWRSCCYSILSLPLYTATFCLLLAFSALPLMLPYWVTVGWWLQADPANGYFVWLLSIVYPLASVIGVLTLPYVSFALMKAHWWTAKALLGRPRHEALVQQVSDLSSAEGRTLRSLERDIHDGPQQQLLRLQMDLAAARRRIASDPEAAEELLIEAQDRSAETLAELRRLSKGIAPPLLQDRGLVAAVQALAERNLIPTTVEAPATLDVPDQIAQNAYFVVSELHANAVKHSHASQLLTEMRLDGADLLVRVADDGRGGAQLVKGGGLAGLEERVHGLGGQLLLISPHGGPTSITVTLPTRQVASNPALSKLESLHQEPLHQESPHQESPHQESQLQGPTR